MRKLAVLSILSLAVLIPSAAHADLITGGDYVRFGNRPGSPGGEFLLSVYDTPGGPLVDQFVTFCVQMTEYMDFTHTFRVGSVSEATDDLPAGDPLDQRTAYLYTQFRNHTLAGYNYGPNNATSANLLQNAIWYLENEAGAGNQSNNPFVRLAQTAVDTGQWSGLGDVAVVNLFFLDGRRAQDQLTLRSVPEPSALLLLSTGFVAFIGTRRRTSRR